MKKIFIFVRFLASAFLMEQSYAIFIHHLNCLSSLSKMLPPSFLIKFRYSATCALALPLHSAHLKIRACCCDRFVFFLLFWQITSGHAQKQKNTHADAAKLVPKPHIFDCRHYNRGASFQASYSYQVYNTSKFNQRLLFPLKSSTSVVYVKYRNFKSIYKI